MDSVCTSHYKIHIPKTKDACSASLHKTHTHTEALMRVPIILLLFSLFRFSWFGRWAFYFLCSQHCFFLSTTRHRGGLRMWWDSDGCNHAASRLWWLIRASLNTLGSTRTADASIISPPHNLGDSDISFSSCIHDAVTNHSAVCFLSLKLRISRRILWQCVISVVWKSKPIKNASEL